jgi:hypothetical protein
VLGRGMIFNTQHTENGKYIKKGKQHIINLDNKRGNFKRIEFVYKERDKLLISRDTKSYEDPVCDGGVACLKVKSVADSYNN